MASLKEKFVEELDYLRRLGRVFSRRNPALEPFLGGSAKDPGVQHLLEGFAFLTARLRLKIDDDFPEITQPLLQALDPACLQTSPSMTIMRFTPTEGALTAPHRVSRATVVQSRRVQGVRCQFRTCTDVTLLPLTLESIHDSHGPDGSLLRVTLQALPGTSLHTLDCDDLEFHLSGSEDTASMLYGWLGRHLQDVRLECDDRRHMLPAHNVEFSGFAPHEALLPQPPGKPDGYRILQEYFCYPGRFHFFRLTGLRRLWPTTPCQRAILEFRFHRPMPDGSRVTTRDLALFCTPAINLFPGKSSAISLDEPRLGHPLEPAGASDAGAREIFSVDGVSCARRATTAEGASPVPDFRPYSSVRHPLLERDEGFYLHEVSAHLLHDGMAHRLSLLRGDGSPYVASDEIARASLTCTDGQLPACLAPGDITCQTDTTTDLAEFTNLTVPTKAWPPEFGGDHQWHWISNLSPSYLTLGNVEALASFLSAYDLPGLRDIQQARATRRKLGAIRSISTQPVDRMFKALPVRGIQTHLELNPEGYTSEGEMHLLFSVLSHALSVFCTTHSFHTLSIGTGPGEAPYQWPLRPGTQPLM